MRILIIDNTVDRINWGSEPLRRYVRTAPGATITVRRAPQGDLPKTPRDYDRIIISGSGTSCRSDAPWIDSLHAFIRTAIDENKPLLGVCYGHQSLVRALGGKELMRRAEKSEHGWTRIELLDESPLFAELPQTFHSFSAHFEEVSRLPTGMRNLARSRDCAIQACQLGDRPVYGIQFHPEKNAEDAALAFEERRRQENPSALLHPNETKKYFNPKIAEKIFSNFLSVTR